jgi:hypothetical protein
LPHACDYPGGTSADVAARAKWDPIKITGGLFADEAMRLLRG